MATNFVVLHGKASTVIKRVGLALAAIYDGGRRTDAAKLGGVSRLCATGFCASTPRARRVEEPLGWWRPIETEAGAQAISRRAGRGPIPAIHGVVRVAAISELYEEFGVSVDESTVGKTLREMGYRKISARPRHHAQNEYVVEDFKNFPAQLAEIKARLDPGVEIELWWQDEARIGQKNKITRRWAKRGSRPSAPKDQRTKSASIFGAICPAKGKGAGLVMPYADTHAMNLHLAEISANVDPGAHAVILMDQAGWHTTPKLLVPDNITLMELPNPVEKRMAVHQGQLALKPRLRRLRGHSRLVLRSLEQAH